MSEETIYLTEDGAAELRAELRELIDVKRPMLAERLREAIAMGDLSENADYADAKEQQGFLEGRVQQLEHILRNATIVAERPGAADIHVGSRVTVVEEGYEDEPETYLIVGAAEANPVEGKVSYESPMGKALMGRRAGDAVTVAAPAGALHFKIKEVK